MSGPTRHILVTGGCGFIGSAVVRALLADGATRVTNLDALTYAGGEDNLAEALAGGDAASRYRLVRGDVCDAPLVRGLVAEADAVLHLAAESHVDRAIDDASVFVKTNVLGTQVVAEAVLAQPRAVPLVISSTDEVFGDLPLDDPGRKFNEDSPYAPRNPYAASKAAGDLLALALHLTHGLDVRVTHGCNTLGPYQHPEKLIPRFVTNLILGRKLPLYGDGANVRDWVHVDDHAAALLAVLERGVAGRRYCVSAGQERSNRQITGSICAAFGVGDEVVERVADRKGHDRRYAMDAARLRSELGWSPAHDDFEAALRATVAWYRDHEPWWRPRASAS